MVKEYPVVVWTEKGKRKAYIPDFDLYVDGLRTAKDAIGNRWLELGEKGDTMPEPSSIEVVSEKFPKKKIELVQVDHEKYVEKETVRKFQEEFWDRLQNPIKYGPSQEQKDACDAIVMNLIQKYYTPENIEKLDNAIINRDSFSTEHSRGGLSMENGYYCRSLLTEIRVGNVSRGKLLTKITGKAPDYTYYFTENNQITLVCKEPGGQFSRFTYVERTGDVEFSLGNKSVTKKGPDKEFDYVMISEAQYDCGKQIGYTQVWFYELSYKSMKLPNDYNLLHEEYCYDEKGRLSSGKIKTCHMFDRETYYIDEYEETLAYSEEGELLGYYWGENNEKIASIKPQLWEIITGKKKEPKKKFNLKSAVSKSVRAEIKEWDEHDIYAVSLFVNSDGEEVVDFAVSYNAESDCPGAGSADEARWNYADWRQDESDLMWILDESGRQIKYQELLNIASKVAAKIQEEHILQKKFKRPIPIIIHGYEYGEDELEATRKANPNGEAADFFRWISADFGV